MIERRILWGVRIALVAALAFSVAFPDLPQFEGKGMAFRAPFYLLPMAAVPIGWRLRGRREPYPSLADALIVSPFLVDTLGNALNFYNTYDATFHNRNWNLAANTSGMTFAADGTSVRPREFVPVFHRWIQTQAVEDQLRTYDATEVFLVTRPSERAEKAAETLRERLQPPFRHVILT